MKPPPGMGNGVHTCENEVLKTPKKRAIERKIFFILFN
jgi:hypothetical protein